MSEMLQLEVITPDRQVFSGEVTDVLLPGIEGEFGVLKGHTPFLSGLDYGLMSYTKAEGSKKEFFVIGQGYAEVTGSRVIVIIETVLPVENVDVANVQKDRDSQQQKLAKIQQDDPEGEKIKKEIKMLDALLKAANRQQ
ncbi:MAG: ATP synthase F1 subunit epsilon [Deltaproteobacteria bacterium]|nr:ATP synthase F1 subunit epsilon [Deltaproteobacteria bacterium]